MKKSTDCANFEGNPNRNAKIGFVVFYPFQFHVFKNIYKHLENEAEFIVDLGAFFPVEQPDHLVRTIISLLKSKKVFFRVLPYKDYFFRRKLEEFFSSYELLVSLWNRGCIKLECNKERKKATMPYGAGKELTTFGLWKRHFDLILAYGERDHRFYSQISGSEIVGNSKFDNWFNDALDSDFIDSVREKIDPDRKTVLYLPTHSDLCSIDNLAEPLKKLGETHNVIVKLHYYNIYEEPERVKKLENENIILFGDDVDLLALLKIADVVLSDNSSAIFDAILADKPLVTADLLPDEYLDREHRNIKAYRRGFSNPLTYSGSIEQRVKRDGTVLVVKRVEDLEKIVEEAVSDPRNMKEARERIIKEIFAFNDGKCGERAAEALKRLMKAKAVLEKPLLFHLIQVSENSICSRMEHEAENFGDLRKNTNLALEDLERSGTDRIYFSVVALVDNRNTKKIEVSLNSLINQKYPSDNYEIIILAGENLDKLKEIASNVSPVSGKIPFITFVRARNNLLGRKDVIEAMGKARGEIILFTKTSYFARLNWLAQYHIAYAKKPFLESVFGNVQDNPKNSNIYSLCDPYIEELCNIFNIWRKGGYPDIIKKLRNNQMKGWLTDSFSNISFRKEPLFRLISEVDNNSLDLLELGLKAKAASAAREQFVYSPVFRFNKKSMKIFCRDNFTKGFVYHVFRKKNPDSRSQYECTIFSPIEFSIISLIETGFNLKFAFIVFIGTFYRWLGKMYEPDSSKQ